MNFKRILTLLLAFCMLTAALSGCSGGKTEPAEPTESISGAEPVVGGSITVGIAQDLDDSLDPHLMVAAGTREVLFNVFEGLVKPDTDGNLIPAVAQSCDVSPEGDTFTFTLREGVKFHDGSTVTVGDIVYSISRAAGLSGGETMVEELGVIESVEATDEKTVVIKTAEPNIELLANLTVGIIPENSDPADGLIGTGPFKYSSRTPQENIIIEKFDDYWGEEAYLDTVIFKIVDNADALVMNLKSGAIDLCAHLTAAQAAELEDFTILEGTMNLVQALYLNNSIEPFSDIRVRQAISYAIDPQQVMDFIADGRGTALGSSMYPAFHKYFDDELTDYYAQDVQKAKELLADAGYAEGFALSITVPSNYLPHVDTAQVLVEQLKAIGITATIDLVDWGTWVSDVYQGRNYQSTVIGFDAATLTASAMLARFVSDNPKNISYFADEEYDETYAKAISAGSDEEQTKLFRRCLEILTEQCANAYIQDLCDLVAMRSGIAGYEFYPLYVMDMSRVYFTK